MKHHGAMHKSPSKQQVCVMDGKYLHFVKNWTHAPSVSGSYISQAGILAGSQTSFRNLQNPITQLQMCL